MLLIKSLGLKFLIKSAIQVASFRCPLNSDIVIFRLGYSDTRYSDALVVTHYKLCGNKNFKNKFVSGGQEFTGGNLGRVIGPNSYYRKYYRYRQYSTVEYYQ